MKEFSQLSQMVYANYSNSSPIARKLKIKIKVFGGKTEDD